MLLYLHPIRNEALTATETLLTRWSLETNPAAPLARCSIAPESVFHLRYAPSGQLLTFGGITGAPDGTLFARERFNPQQYQYPAPCVLEWRTFEDLTPARTSPVPHTLPIVMSLASAPNGRCLVLEDEERIFLLDWHTGQVLSHHASGVYQKSGLTFDETSTFVAGV
jgi:hypothetical protein